MDHDSSVIDDKFSIRHRLDLTSARWRKLSPRADGTVEFAVVGYEAATRYILLRQNPDPRGDRDTVLVFTPSEWDAFLSGARDGEFDRPH